MQGPFGNACFYQKLRIYVSCKTCEVFVSQITMKISFYSIKYTAVVLMNVLQTKNGLYVPQLLQQLVLFENS